MRDQISTSAKVLDDMLMYAPAHGECPVTMGEAQAMWNAAKDLHGFAAVRAFLEVCKTIESVEQSNG